MISAECDDAPEDVWVSVFSGFNIHVWYLCKNTVLIWLVQIRIDLCLENTWIFMFYLICVSQYVHVEMAGLIE